MNRSERRAERRRGEMALRLEIRRAHRSGDVAARTDAQKRLIAHVERCDRIDARARALSQRLNPSPGRSRYTDDRRARLAAKAELQRDPRWARSRPASPDAVAHRDRDAERRERNKRKALRRRGRGKR